MKLIQEKIILAIKHIEENKENYIYPRYKTITSFLKGIKHSNLYHIYSKYPDVCGTFPSTYKTEVKNNLDDLVNNGYLLLKDNGDYVIVEKRVSTIPKYLYENKGAAEIFFDSKELCEECVNLNKIMYELSFDKTNMNLIDYVKKIASIEMINKSELDELITFLGLKNYTDLNYYDVKKKIALKSLEENLSKKKVNFQSVQEIIMNQYYGFVINIVWSTFKNSSVPLIDLIQEGNMILWNFLNEFVQSRRISFEKHAAKHIKYYLKLFEYKYNFISLPPDIVFTIEKFKKTYFTIKKEKFCEPTYEEIADKLGTITERIQIIKGLIADIENPMSLDVSSNLYGDSRLDFISDNNSENPLETMIINEIKKKTFELLGTLRVREQKIIMLRYGLFDNNPKNLSEVANIMHISRERVRQIEAKALRRLKHPSRSGELREFIRNYVGFNN